MKNSHLARPQTPLDSVIITKDPSKNYDSFRLENLICDKDLGIYFETEEQRKEVGHCFSPVSEPS